MKATEKATGIVRSVDELGRIVLPVELRRVLDIPQGTPLEILMEGTRIVLRKYSRACSFCGRTERRVALKEFCGKQICKQCIDMLRKELSTSI